MISFVFDAFNLNQLATLKSERRSLLVERNAESQEMKHLIRSSNDEEDWE